MTWTLTLVNLPSTRMTDKSNDNTCTKLLWMHDVTSYIGENQLSFVSSSSSVLDNAVNSTTAERNSMQADRNGIVSRGDRQIVCSWRLTERLNTSSSDQRRHHLRPDHTRRSLSSGRAPCLTSTSRDLYVTASCTRAPSHATMCYHILHCFIRAGIAMRCTTVTIEHVYKE